MNEVFRVAKKYVLINEDTPSNSLQSYFNRLHAGYGDWGTNYDGFRTVSEWLCLLAKYGLVRARPIYAPPTMWNFPYVYYTDRTAFLITK